MIELILYFVFGVALVGTLSSTVFLGLALRFFRQDYPDYEILFAADEADDAALDVVREVCARYPHIRSRVLVTGAPWPNPVVYPFHCLAEAAAYDILVTTDSDVEVGPRYLREIVPPLLDPQVGMVTCVYRGKNVAGFFSGLTAIGMSVEMTAGVLVANLLEGMKFGLGPTTVVRKDSLAGIGGYTALKDYIVNCAGRKPRATRAPKVTLEVD